MSQKWLEEAILKGNVLQCSKAATLKQYLTRLLKNWGYGTTQHRGGDFAQNA